MSAPAKVKVFNTLYMLLELQVLWFPDGYDPEEEENLGRQVKLKSGPLMVYTEHIAGFHPNDNGNTMIRLDTGDVFEALVKYESFRGIMEAEQIKKDMLVSGDN